MGELTSWAWLLLLAQLLFYVSCASAIASCFLLCLIKLLSSASSGEIIAARYHTFLISYGQWMSLIGLLAVSLYFLLSVGAFAESGFTGMFDSTIFSIIWESPLGSVASYRLFAFLILFLCFLLIAKFYENLTTINYTKYIALILVVVALYLLARSFSRSGHSVELPLALQYVLSLHVFLAMVWIGSLYPLYKACSQLSNNVLYSLMHNFGNYAMWLVCILLVAGLIILYSLLHSLEEFITTIYGQWFIGKLVGVFLVLLLALRHKIYLSPALFDKRNASAQLAVSIKVEAILVTVVLFFTYIVSNLVGPEHLSH